MSDPDDGQARERFEFLVSRAATTVVERLAGGVAVGLIAGGARVPPVVGPHHAGRLLAVLAEVEPQATADAPAPWIGGSLQTVRLTLEDTA
jgi:uncharacterized protein (DUF58 family)